MGKIAQRMSVLSQLYTVGRMSLYSACCFSLKLNTIMNEWMIILFLWCTDCMAYKPGFDALLKDFLLHGYFVFGYIIV